MKQLLLLILCVTCACLFAVLPLMQPGFFPIHDNTQISRVSEMATALTDGMLPVRWVPNLGYGFGYPIFNFYAPLAYYVGGLFVVGGLPAIEATKLMIGIGMVLAGVTMYLLAQSLMRRDAAIIAGLLYMYAPYHGVNLYVRGAIAELWAYAFLPVAFYGLIRVFRSRNWTSVLIGAGGLAGVILSHNLTAYMLLPFYGVLLLYLLVSSMRKGDRLSILLLLTSVGLGLMLSSFYWLPALTEMKFTNVDSQITGGSQYKDHFVCPEQLWAGVRGYAGSAPGCLDGISFQIGKLHLLLTALAILLAAVFYRKAQVLLVVVAAGLIATVMLLPVSRIVWEVLPRIAYVQFPWRYLSFVSLFFSLAGAAGISMLFENYLLKKQFLRWTIVTGVSTVTIVLYSVYFQPQQLLTVLPGVTDPVYIRWDVAKISDEYLPPEFIKPKSPESTAASPIKGDGIEVNVRQHATQQFRTTITASRPAEIIIQKAVFPAWRFQLNGKAITPEERDGKYMLQVAAGTSEITGVYMETPVERIGNTFTVIGIILSVIGIIMWRYYYKYTRKTS